MSIEAHLTALKEALDRNTEALLKSGGAAPAASAPAKTEKKGAEKKDEPKVTQDQMNAALVKLKDDFGTDVAKAIIAEVGKAAKMGEIKPANYQATYDAAVKKHAELTAAGPGDDNGEI